MISDVQNSKTLIEAFRIHVAQKPNDVAFVYLEDGEDAQVSITIGELDRSARAFAAHLQTLVKAGDRALLLYPSGLEFVTAYLGCLYADVIAVPTTVPHLKRATPRLRLMMEDAEAHVACTTQGVYEKVKFLLDENSEFANLKWVISETIEPGLEANWSEPEFKPDNIAFLQYTSGSTSVPKGVMISNLNLLRTIQDVQLGVKFNDNSVMVTWLPIFHDMGLIYGLLTPLYTGRPCYIMSPVSFLEKPFRWLNAISKHGGTHTAAPNFAYELCTRKISEEDKKSLDLSRFTVALNAAEPVRLETLRDFSAAFKSCGFDYNSFTPGYGLAEATVKVSNKPIGQPPAYCTLDADEIEKNKLVFLPDNHPKGYTNIGCGWSSINADIRIVNPTTCRLCPPDEIGEIWVQSESVAQGYWQRPDASQETFKAQIADTGEGPFLRTGDMGFIYNGEIYIAGRIKDMVIIQGRNYYPQDIELSVEKCHPAVRPSCGAAFAIDDGEAEHLIVVYEVRREYRKSSEFKEIADAMRMAVARNHGLRAHALVLIMPSTVHKTTSGKIQRSAVREAFLNGTLEVLYEWRAPGIPTSQTTKA